MKNKYLKTFALLFVLQICVPTHVSAQLWEELPLDFNRRPVVMYYDSIDDVSYIAGDFDVVDGIDCNVVKWDGTDFTFLPFSPIGNILSIVRYNDNIYFGGSGIGTESGLAYWDGNDWTRLDTFSGNPNKSVVVTSFYVYDSKLYTTGNMKNIGNSNADMVAVWNDTVWTDLFSIDTMFDEPKWAKSIVNYKGNFYVVPHLGYIDMDSNYVCGVVMYDGNHWKGLTDTGTLTYCGNSWVNMLLVWNDTMYIAGLFGEKYGNPGNGIVKWDGNNYHKMSHGLYNTNHFLGSPEGDDHGGPFGLMVVNNELYAWGGFNNVDGIYQPPPNTISFAKWTGERWCTMGTFCEWGIANMGRFRDTIYAMGNFRVINDDSIKFIAKFLGGTYTDTCATPNLNINSINPIQETPQPVSIYPNPNKGSFTLSINNLKNKAELSIYDITGRVVHTVTINNPEQQIVINGISKGLYIGRIVSKENVAVFKFRVD